MPLGRGEVSEPAPPSGDEPVSPELALVDPELRRLWSSRLTRSAWAEASPAARDTPAPAPRARRRPRPLAAAVVALVLLAALVSVRDQDADRTVAAERPAAPGTPVGDAQRERVALRRAAPPPPSVSEQELRATQPARAKRDPKPASRAAGRPPQPSRGEARREPSAPRAHSTANAPDRPAATAPARVRTVVLEWEPVANASYYNVILWRGQSRALDLWPAEARVEIAPAARGRRLEPGRYLWFVYPGFGARDERRYGDVAAHGVLEIRPPR